MKIVLSGSGGLIGEPLIRELSKSHEISILKRHLPLKANTRSTQEFFWNPKDHGGPWTGLIDGADAVINLCGENIAKGRWTDPRKEALRDSRLEPTAALVEAVAQAKNKPKIFINASAVGFYGARDEKPLDEQAQAGFGFLPDLCAEWEKEVEKISQFNVRLITLRTGIVLSKKGGALAKMIPPFQLFAGGPLGSGKQMMSWIHIDDEVSAIIKCLEDSKISGPVNLTAPNPVSMKQFSSTLGKALKRPSIMPVPGIALKVLLGEMAEMLLTGQNVIPSKLQSAGFRFRFPTLEGALQNLLQG